MFKPYEFAQVSFTKKQEIGQDGQNSKTYIAHDHQLNAEIVIKQIPKSKLASAANYFDESRCLYASAHPNVVQLHYACQDVDSIYIAMPFYQFGSIKPLITGCHMPLRRILTIACQVLSGLHNIHSKGLIHFDIKPDNIMLSSRRDAMLSDFGLAKQMIAGTAAPNQFYGKMAPPEVINGQSTFDLTFDIYQFGLTLYRMCNGNDEFYRQLAVYQSGGNFGADVVNGVFPNRKKFPLHIPSKLRKIINKCLSVSPNDRYQSAIEVANALAAIDGAHLDWQLTEASGERKWERNDNGTSIVLSVAADGTSECYKLSNGGSKRRVAKMCGKLTDAAIAKFLGDP